MGRKCSIPVPAITVQTFIAWTTRGRSGSIYRRRDRQTYAPLIKFLVSVKDSVVVTPPSLMQSVIKPVDFLANYLFPCG